MKTRISRAVLLAGAAFILAGGNWAFADRAAPSGAGAAPQPAQRDGAPAPAAEKKGTIEKVIVTARRKSEALQKVPGAVTSVSGKTLEQDLGAQNIGSLQNVVPNLNLAQGRGSASSANIYIRGIGQPDALQTFDPGVGVYIDDVYISRIQGALFDVYDLDRIEVLRGPQGTLYGKNTIGGAIKLVTREPSDQLEANGSVTYGSYNLLELRGRISGPITDQISGSFTLYRSIRDGYVHDPLIPNRAYNDKDTFAGRGSLYFTPSDDFKVVLNVDFDREDPALVVGQARSPLFRTELVGGAHTTIFVPPPGEYNFETSVSPTLPNGSQLRHSGGGMTATWDVNDQLTLKSISGIRYLDYDTYIDIDATPLRLGDVFVGIDQNQFSQEFQGIYTGNHFDVVGGLFVLNENISSNQKAFGNDLFTLFGGAFPAIRTVADNLNLHSYAAFAQGDYNLTEDVQASAGLRYTYEQKNYFRTTSVNGGPAFAFNGVAHWEDVSPLFSLSYQWTPDVMVYGRAAKGFKSGGFNGRANSPLETASYNPETVWSYELGAKTTFWDNRVRANVDVFYNDYKDFQARVGGVTANDFPVLNAGKLQQYGAELELTAKPDDHWLIQSVIGWLEADYLIFFDDRFPGNDHSKQTPAFSPELTGRLDVSYTFTLPDGSTVTIGADANYRAQTYLSVDNSPVLVQNPFWLFNARAVWLSESGRYFGMVHGKNLSDEVYMTDAQEFSNVAGIRTAYFGDPETVNLTLGVKY